MYWSLRLISFPGKLRWTATIDGEEVVEKNEPQASGWLRFKAFFSKLVPEKQL